jgi:hypothetical protein
MKGKRIFSEEQTYNNPIALSLIILGMITVLAPLYYRLFSAIGDESGPALNKLIFVTGAVTLFCAVILYFLLMHKLET